ncbi:hypothetical protein A8C32_09875 [Flavivirga aquatica]|uniref:Gp5/Type VI secretion system Vgr protein OB-fold domain-containing protein n=1 Tax=Flavivirga aquatica TaxID=1849968 RepID=A0A1E5TEL1_9FLAO|nr:phage baseplate assembly protein V [Flavivirga aquatica]OEK09810.1 hypothetical protein A8C32_09875 [Flavivirga aquatica]
MDYKTSISIDGKYLSNFEQVTLKQRLNTHHEFKIQVDHDEIEALGVHTLEASKAWLGKSVVISFDEAEFVGIITNLKLQHNDGHQGDIEITGYSKTILLEQGKHTTSWVNKSLANIIKDTLDTVNIQALIEPEHRGLLNYEAQYGETHYQFLQRLAKQHYEWFFYDGLKLVIGQPDRNTATKLQYGRELSNISIGMEARANSYNIFSYNALEDTKNESKTKNNVEGLNELGMDAFNTSLDIFKGVANSHAVARTQNKSELETSVKNKQAAAVADLNILEADCNLQNLTVGSIIKVSSAKWSEKDEFDVKNYGEYIIIDIEHKATGSTTYSSHIKAIPSGVKVPPEPQVDLPQANPQLATVVSNEDPKGKGRVQVQFQWQKHEKRTNWIRVMTPDAGQSANHEQNRGHVFIPEEGDQVMVGFRYSDPNRPFVMGSLFNGNTGAGGRVDNTHKSIITRSGHTIEFNDTNRQESITITDKNQNIVFIDTANSSIRISAPENISISAKNIDITASENLTASAGENIGINAGDDISMGAGDDTRITAGEDLSIFAKNITEQASGNFESLSMDLEHSADIITKNSSKEGINLNSSGNVKSNTGEKVKLF